MGVKTSNANSSLKSLLNFSKLLLNFVLNYPHKSSILKLFFFFFFFFFFNFFV